MSEEPELVPLARPVIGEAEEQAVLEVLRSGHLSLGPRLPAFEEAFAARVGARHASAVSSGTAGLHLALRAVGVEASPADAGTGPGPEVVTSPFSFIASSNAGLFERAVPVFVDVDPVTLNVPSAAVAAAVTDRTAALLPVHIFGIPAPTPQLEGLGVPIVEDACEALGAVHPDGVPVGGRGHPAVFAFYANKQMTTGEGGIVTVGDRATKDRLDSERNQGRAPGMAWLDHDRLGFNYRLSDLQCALGLAQLGRLDELLGGRERVAAAYAERLADLAERTGLALPATDADLAATEVAGARRSWFVYVVRLPRDLDRNATITELGRRGIQTRDYLPAIHLFSFYRERFGFREGQFPVAEDAARRGLALPLFPTMTEAQVDRVVAELTDVLTARR
ncbi:DegT/DnrJ/EryC1/StrS family aminotransferase [Patulibacter brassicae]|uniref:DegT/DnrJ/EryC1/StrS family aminotransferase n=1 Tax=Patulibacter brassicae TaxID=1705717 RepID=A0ABU4VFZ3_9ACTN|nr:DegT/DnrJ/EryC1/StrS family aminotransferase [Patulibacter brassicae]MDX8150287.1 DegT/DnrJ/EryC1/StrS family aminotransferase [Patulibacter brassicae]